MTIQPGAPRWLCLENDVYTYIVHIFLEMSLKGMELVYPFSILFLIVWNNLYG